MILTPSVNEMEAVEHCYYYLLAIIMDYKGRGMLVLCGIVPEYCRYGHSSGCVVFTTSAVAVLVKLNKDLADRTDCSVYSDKASRPCARITLMLSNQLTLF